MSNQFPGFQGPQGQGQQGNPFGNQQFPGQMMPPFGQFPGQQGPSFSPGFPSPGQHSPEGNAPTSPPPSFVPQQRQTVSTFAVDPGAIRGCLFRNTYIWLRNGNSFWFFPTFVGRQSVAGFRWTGRRWTYYGTDLDRISSFQCF